MRYHIVLATGQLVAEPNGGPIGTQSNPLEFPRANRNDEFQFLDTDASGFQVPKLLPEGTTFEFGLCLEGKYESDPIVSIDPDTIVRPSNPEPGATPGFYTARFRGDTVEAQDVLDTPDGNFDNDKDNIQLAGQFSWKLPDAPAGDPPDRSQRVFALLKNVYSSTAVTESACPKTWPVLQKPDGTLKRFPVAANTDAARGVALVAARAAATPGDLIVVGPGVFAVTANLLKDGVTFDFKPGSSVVLGGTAGSYLFDDLGVSSSCSVLGQGAFRNLQTGDVSGGVISLGNSASVFTMHVREIECAISGIVDSGSGCLLHVANCARVEIQAGRLLARYDNNQLSDVYGAGKVFVTTTEALSEFGGFGVGGAEMHVTADTIDISHNNGSAFANGLSGAATDTLWVRANVIRGGNILSYQLSGKWYFILEKAFGQFWIEGTSQLYLNAQKLTHTNYGGEAGSLLELIGGQSWVQVAKIECANTALASAGIINVTGGSHRTKCQRLVGDSYSTGVNLVAGNLDLDGVIDCALAPAKNPIVKAGGTLILRSGTSLIAASTRDSISATTAQDVVALGAWANREPSSNVTITTPGGFTVHSSVS